MFKSNCKAVLTANWLFKRLGSLLKCNIKFTLIINIQFSPIVIKKKKRARKLRNFQSFWSKWKLKCTYPTDPAVPSNTQQACIHMFTESIFENVQSSTLHNKFAIEALQTSINSEIIGHDIFHSLYTLYYQGQMNSTQQPGRLSWYNAEWIKHKWLNCYSGFKKPFRTHLLCFRIKVALMEWLC